MKLNRILTLSALGFGLVSGEATASGDYLTAHAELLIAAAPDEVWKVVKNFDDLGWHPAVTRTTLMSGENNRVGAIRTITLADGATLTERLQAHDDEGHTQQYSIVDSPLPAGDYLCSITVTAEGNGISHVTWQSRFRPHAQGADAEARSVRDALSDTYAAGLKNLERIIANRR